MMDVGGEEVPLEPGAVPLRATCRPRASGDGWPSACKRAAEVEHEGFWRGGDRLRRVRRRAWGSGTCAACWASVADAAAGRAFAAARPRTNRDARRFPFLDPSGAPRPHRRGCRERLSTLEDFQSSVAEVIDAGDLLPHYELAAVAVLAWERPGEEPSIRVTCAPRASGRGAPRHAARGRGLARTHEFGRTLRRRRRGVFLVRVERGVRSRSWAASRPTP